MPSRLAPMTGKRGWRTSVACSSTPAAEVAAGTDRGAGAVAAGADGAISGSATVKIVEAHAPALAAAAGPDGDPAALAAAVAAMRAELGEFVAAMKAAARRR